MRQSSSLIILAGGKSSRMGTPKGLLKHNNQYWILSQIENFIGHEIFIGLGFDKELYFEAIPWLELAVTTPINYKEKSVKVIINPDPKLGPFSNIQSVLKQLKTKQSVFILPIDVPILNKKEQKEIETNENLVVIPRYKKRKGHPIKLKYEFWQKLLSIHLNETDARLDYQIKKNSSSKISFIETSNELCILNLNTPNEWLKFTKL